MAPVTLSLPYVLRQLEEEGNIMDDSFFAFDSQPPSQPDVACPSDPSFVPKSPELEASNRTKDASYVQMDLLSENHTERTSKDKGKARYIPSNGGESEWVHTPASEPDQVPLVEDSQQEDLTSRTDLDDGEFGRLELADGEEQPSGYLDNPTTEDGAANDDDIPPAWVRKGGRPPKAFIKKAAAVADAYLNAIHELMSTFGVSQRVAYMATGLQPRKIETRETNSWNAHQRVYKMEHPKVPGESVVEFKTRQHLDYELHIKPLTKDEKTEYRDECEQTIMEYFFSGQGKELKAASPAKRVDAACKALQKLAQMISRADCEIQSFGGANYIGPDKAGRASGGAIFVSSDTVMKAIKMFDIKTSSIMLTTGDFLQAVVAQGKMTHVQGAGSPVACVDKGTKKRSAGRDKNNKHKDFNTEKETHGIEDEPPHAAEFKSSDFRKKGRKYLGLTYNKVNPGRTNIDWINFLPNALRGKYRLINCNLSPHPGEPGFSAEKIPLHVWQDIGKMVTVEDFHPVTGGCNPGAPRFIPWTNDEKKFNKGTQEYNAIALVTDTKGNPLLTVEQAEQRIEGEGVRPQAESIDSDANQGWFPEPRNLEALSGKQTTTGYPHRAPAAPMNFKAPDQTVSRPKARSSVGTSSEGSHSATPPFEAPACILGTHAQQGISKKQVIQAASTSIPDNITTSTKPSQKVSHNGELLLAQYNSVVFQPPPARTPSAQHGAAPTPFTSSATRAFSVNFDQGPPSNRGFAFPQPKSSGLQLGPSHRVPSSFKPLRDVAQGAAAAKASSRKPSGAQVKRGRGI